MRVLRCGISMLALIGCTTSSGGFPDATFLVDTTPGVSAPVDANRSRGPVVVGQDLTPADYSCAPIAPSELPNGDPMPVVLEVRDWSDQHLRAGVNVQAASDHTWAPMLDCTGHPDCGTGVTDESGHVTLSMRAGRVWLATWSTADPTLPISWISGIAVPHGATMLVVPALGTATLAALNGGGALAVGRARDCSGAPVHRMHVRAFDEGNLELLGSGGRAGVRYANDGGSVVDDDRTTIDGVFVVQPDELAGVRIEAWGLREVGGREVLLGCLLVDFSQNANATLVDIPPLASDAPAECGSVP